MKRPALALLALAIAACGPLLFAASPPPRLVVTVTRVVDGDTVVVSDRTESFHVRLLGVNTPETHHPTKPVEPCGPEAEAFTRNALAGKVVQIETHGIDIYGRTLAWLWLDGKLFQARLMRQGWSPLYTKYPNSREEEFRALEAKAKAHHRGLWDPHGCAPSPVPSPSPSPKES